MSLDRKPEGQILLIIVIVISVPLFTSAGPGSAEHTEVIRGSSPVLDEFGADWVQIECYEDRWESVGASSGVTNAQLQDVRVNRLLDEVCDDTYGPRTIQRLITGAAVLASTGLLAHGFKANWDDSRSRREGKSPDLG